MTKYTLCPLTQLIEMRISTISIFFALQGKCMHVHSVMGSNLAWHISVICTPTLKNMITSVIHALYPHRMDHDTSSDSGAMHHASRT